MAGLIPFNRKNDLTASTFDDFRNMLDDFFMESWPFRRSLAADTFKIDVQENKNDYVVEAELPGVNKEDLNITLDEGRLTIAAVKNETVDKSNSDKNYIHKERRYSSMSRSIMLADAEENGIKAKLDNGVLTICVPKRARPNNQVVIDIE
jgi:HSP20 family protein